jgi:hypothetical protein
MAMRYKKNELAVINQFDKDISMNVSELVTQYHQSSFSTLWQSLRNISRSGLLSKKLNLKTTEDGDISKVALFHVACQHAMVIGDVTGTLQLLSHISM